MEVSFRGFSVTMARWSRSCNKTLLLVFLLVIAAIAYAYTYWFNVTFPTLEKHPEVEILKSFFINMEESVDRRESFLEAYNGDIERVPGIRVGNDVNTGKIGKGLYGCGLAHALLMQRIGDMPDGWYAVYEDDARGDFKGIGKNEIVRNIVARTEKQFINLSIGGNGRRPAYSLNFVYNCMFAYLVTPLGARVTSALILKYLDTEACDGTTDVHLRNPIPPLCRQWHGVLRKFDDDIKSTFSS